VSRLDIIGPGFGRTGTMSCKAAVDALGFGPCYHMSEVYTHGDADLWAAAINGASLPIDKIFEGYRSAFDWPACSWWKELKAANPSAKIVLTRRDPDAWYDSIERTIFKALPSISDDPQRNAWRVHTRKLIFDQTFHNDLGRENVIAVLRAHEADVIASVPADELLVFDVADGWEPLCAFLGVAVPDTPFPRTNSTTEFRKESGLDSA
jgi:Sulfotransferase domain